MLEDNDPIKGLRSRLSSIWHHEDPKSESATRQRLFTIFNRKSELKRGINQDGLSDTNRKL